MEMSRTFCMSSSSNTVLLGVIPFNKVKSSTDDKGFV